MITVFIGTYNRTVTLERTIRSYRKFKTPHELVIVDNGTNHPGALETLAQLKPQVKRIYHLPPCNSMEEATDNFNVAILDQYERSTAKWFAVTEADVCFENTHPKALDVYIKLAKAKNTAVGPHLRVNKKIPVSYPLRSRVLACESRLLYRDDMMWHDRIPYTDTQTDTTFHLFPRTPFFNRLHMNPLRVAQPYDAMHLDWYLNITNPNKENGVYINDPLQVGSWGKAWIRNYWNWYHDHSPQEAFQRLVEEPKDSFDLCNNSFIISWCYQHGIGVAPDHERSVRWLHAAIPITDTEYYWPYEKNWMDMIYTNDFKSLGWDD